MMKEATNTFTDRVLEVVRSIPKGSVLTYGAVAECAGSKGAARAVGTIMKRSYDPGVPCHRVIRSDGGVGEYNRGGAKQKIKILREEGYIFKNTKS